MLDAFMIEAELLVDWYLPHRGGAASAEARAHFQSLWRDALREYQANGSAAREAVQRRRGELAEAQARGYAEADPTFDIEGIDAAHKLTIMSAIAFGVPMQFDKVYTDGVYRGFTVWGPTRNAQLTLTKMF